MRKKFGFTLVELIILVGIMSILASVTIPIFLEAQVHSKISRSRSGLRCIGAALEAYFVDNKAYIPDGHSNIPPNTYAMYINYLLTTPVSYISLSNIKDPFFQSPGQGIPQLYRYINIKFRYLDMLGLESSYNNYNEIFGAWSLYSNGPDMKMGPFSETTRLGVLWACTIIYDPTNGIISTGDIIRCHKTGDPPKYWQ